MLDIYIDADACPVKEDTIRVAKRYSLKVTVVSNSPISLPRETWIVPVVVGSGFDAVDDWIAEQIQKDDIVITNDLLLAAQCLKKEVRVIDPRGKILTEDNIGDALANRELMYELRQMGSLKTGPKQMGKKHRSNFLAALDQVINKVRSGNR